MEHLLQDLRYSWRLTRRSPGSSAFIVVLLALGTGLNIAVFDAVNALLLRPLPVRAPDELVRMVTIDPKLGPRSFYSYRAWEILKDRGGSFSDVIGYDLQSVTEWTESGGSERLWCEVVTGNYFSALGVTPLLGGVLTPEDGSNPSETLPVVLSHPYWQRRFHGDPSAVGRPLRLGERIFTIVGVTPRGFNGIQVDTTPDVRLPLRGGKSPATLPELETQRKLSLEVVGRLRSGVRLEPARAEAESLYRAALEEESLAPNRRSSLLEERFALEPVGRGLSRLRDRYKSALFLLVGGVALLLLMICANVGGLLLARASARLPETAIRLALGSTPGRLLRMWWIESLLLTSLGGTLGLALAWAATPLFSRVLPPLRYPDTTQLTLSIDWRPDLRVIGFSLALCVASSLLAGSPVALQALRLDLQSALREVRSGSPARLRWSLVALQAAFSTVLVAGSGLLVSTLRDLRALDPGFARDQVVTFAADPRMVGYTEAQSQNLSARLVERVEQLPQVQSVALSSIGLMRGTGLKTTVAPAGQTASAADFLNASIHHVSPEYFETMGIGLIAGRIFRADEPERSPQPVVVNRAFAERFFPGENAVGRRFGFGMNQAVLPAREIIGVVSDAKYRSLREPVPATIYHRWRAGSFVLHVRTQGRPRDLIEPVRRELQALEPRLPFFEVRTLAEEVDTSLWAERFLARVSSAFGAAAVVIALIGVYGTLAYALAEGKREIGIRMALGAGVGQILWACAARPVASVAVGVGLGVGAFHAAAPMLRTLLYGVSPNDPASTAIAILTVLLLAAGTAVVAATAALRVDPARVLRDT